VNPFRGVFVFVVLALAGMNFFSGAACAQNLAQGEFTISQSTHWGNSILPVGNYHYSVETDTSPASVHVWQKGGGFSAVFIPHSVKGENSRGQTEIVLQQVGDTMYVSSVHVREMSAVLNFPAPLANENTDNSDADHFQETGEPEAGSSELFKVVNPGHLPVSIAEAERVYLNVCRMIEAEFSRIEPVRPRLTLHLGAERNLVRYPSREIMLKKWDEMQFAQAVVEIALHELVSPEERRRLTNSAVSRANATVSLCELKGCRN
jgi:hypothetical protein